MGRWERSRGFSTAHLLPDSKPHALVEGDASVRCSDGSLWFNKTAPAMSTPSTGTPLSLVLVCHSYPPVLGGSELEAQRVCATLIRRGYRITVVCAGGDPMPPVRDWVDPEGVPVRIYAAHWKGALKDIVFALRVAG